MMKYQMELCALLGPQVFSDDDGSKCRARARQPKKSLHVAAQQALYQEPISKSLQDSKAAADTA
jgi:hypothetical protein